jgi:hypothetical protein
MPEEQWPHILEVVQSLLPVASQVTLGVFRSQLSESIDREVGETLEQLGTARKRHM